MPETITFCIDATFFFPKDNDIDCKGLCMKDELEKNGGLDNGYNTLTVKPKAGGAVIFNQNIIHESTPMKAERHSENKFIIKTDLMLVRTDTKFGYSISEAEKDDYFTCLNTFRQAQQLEISHSYL